MVKNPPANAGDIRDKSSIPGLGSSPGGGHGNPLKYFARRIPWTEESDGLLSMGLQRVRHDLATRHACTHTLLLFQRSKQRLTNEKHQLGLAPKRMLFPPLTVLISGVIFPRLSVLIVAHIFLSARTLQDYKQMWTFPVHRWKCK